MSQESIQQDRYVKDRLYAIGFVRTTLLVSVPQQCIHVTIEQLTPSNLRLWLPTIVFVPLFGTSEDAATVVERLENIGFQGDIVVICPLLPKPQLVERELRGLGPGKRLRLEQEP